MPVNCACAQPLADTHHVHSGLQSSQENRHTSLTQDHRPPLAHTHTHGYSWDRSYPVDRLWREQVSDCFHLGPVRGSMRRFCWELGPRPSLQRHTDTTTPSPAWISSGENPRVTQEKVPFLGGMLGHKDVLSAWYISGTELARRPGPSGITLMPQGSTPYCHSTLVQ